MSKISISAPASAAIDAGDTLFSCYMCHSKAQVLLDQTMIECSEVGVPVKVIHPFMTPILQTQPPETIANKWQCC